MIPDFLRLTFMLFISPDLRKNFQKRFLESGLQINSILNLLIRKKNANFARFNKYLQFKLVEDVLNFGCKTGDF